LEGVRRARERAAGADLVLWVVDASAPGGEQSGSARPVADKASGPAVIPGRRTAASQESRAAHEVLSAPPSKKSPSDSKTWLVLNKIDLISHTGNKIEHRLHNYASNETPLRSNKPLTNMVKNQLTHRNELESTNSELEFNLSATSGEGFDDLLDQLTRHTEANLAGTEQAFVTRARHRHALEEVLAALRRALAGDVSGREDLLAEELRIAARALGRLTGRVDVEDILDVIFRDFCIGK
jgi:tRNA modification GTPase